MASAGADLHRRHCDRKRRGATSAEYRRPRDRFRHRAGAYPRLSFTAATDEERERCRPASRVLLPHGCESELRASDDCSVSSIAAARRSGTQTPPIRRKKQREPPRRQWSSPRSDARKAQRAQASALSTIAGDRRHEPGASTGSCTVQRSQRDHQRRRAPRTDLSQHRRRYDARRSPSSRLHRRSANRQHH
jgi:hypothetical protein